MYEKKSHKRVKGEKQTKEKMRKTEKCSFISKNRTILIQLNSHRKKKEKWEEEEEEEVKEKGKYNVMSLRMKK